MTAALTAAKPRLLKAITALESNRSRVERFLIVQGAAKDLNVHMKTVRKWIDEIILATPKKERCSECGEYRRVHRLGGHPFTTLARDSQSRFEAWARREMNEEQRHTFVDALRVALDLEPMYHRVRAQRFFTYPEPTKLLRRGSHA